MSSEPFTGGSNPDTGGRAMPPYEGRRENADVGDQSESEKEGAKVGGASTMNPRHPIRPTRRADDMRHLLTSSPRRTWMRTRPETRVSSRTTSRVSSGARI
jgi:hypothetical protein